MTELVKSMVAYGGAWGDPMPDAEDDDSRKQAVDNRWYKQATGELVDVLIKVDADRRKERVAARAEADRLRKTAKSLLGACEGLLDALTYDSSLRCQLDAWTKARAAVADATSNPYMQGEE